MTLMDILIEFYQRDEHDLRQDCGASAVELALRRQVFLQARRLDVAPTSLRNERLRVLYGGELWNSIW